MSVYQHQELEEKYCNPRALQVLFHNRIQKADGKIDNETRKVGMGQKNNNGLELYLVYKYKNFLCGLWKVVQDIKQE